MLSRKCEVDEYSMGLAKGLIIEHANMRNHNGIIIGQLLSILKI